MNLGWLALEVCAATDQIPLSATTNAPAPENPPAQSWNWHVQNTDIVQYHPGFAARYSGPNSLSSASEVKETVSLDVLFGLRLWRGEKLPDILASMNEVAEGVKNTASIMELARSVGVEMPIAEQMFCVLYDAKDPRQAVVDLMSRRLKHELA